MILKLDIILHFLPISISLRTENKYLLMHWNNMDGSFSAYGISKDGRMGCKLYERTSCDEYPPPPTLLTTNVVCKQVGVEL